MTKEEMMQEHNENLQMYVKCLEAALVSSWAYSIERLSGAAPKESRERAEQKLVRF